MLKKTDVASRIYVKNPNDIIEQLSSAGIGNYFSSHNLPQGSVNKSLALTKEEN